MKMDWHKNVRERERVERGERPMFSMDHYQLYHRCLVDVAASINQSGLEWTVECTQRERQIYTVVYYDSTLYVYGTTMDCLCVPNGILFPI